MLKKPNNVAVLRKPLSLRLAVRKEIERLVKEMIVVLQALQKALLLTRLYEKPYKT